MDARKNICLIFLLSACIPHVRSVSLVLDTTGSVVTQGTQATLECYSSTIPANFFESGGRLEWHRDPTFGSSVEIIAKWTRDGGTHYMIDNSDEHFFTDGGWQGQGRFGQYLEIRQTIKKDNGRYSCVLFNYSGMQQASSSFIDLTVKYPPAEHFPLCTAEPKDVGDEIALRCVSEKTDPPVTIQWYKDNLKVADGASVGTVMQSVHDVGEDELGSQFECRLVYDNRNGVEVLTTCQFSQPQVTIAKVGVNRYHAYAYSSPPFVSDLNCTLDPSDAQISYDFRAEFPGFSIMTVSPAESTRNDTNIVCQAKNVFGLGKANMTVNYHTLTVAPEVTVRTLEVDLWPQIAIWSKGEIVTFVCSYQLSMASSFDAKVSITWKYNQDLIDESKATFVVADNLLHVSGLDGTDTDANIACVVSVDEVSKEAQGVVMIATASPCGPTLKEQPIEVEIQQHHSVPLIILGIFIVCGLILGLSLVLRNVLRTHRTQEEMVLSGPNVPHGRMHSRSVRSSQNADQDISRRPLPPLPTETVTITAFKSVMMTSVSTTLASDNSTSEKVLQFSQQAMHQLAIEDPIALSLKPLHSSDIPIPSPPSSPLLTTQVSDTLLTRVIKMQPPTSNSLALSSPPPSPPSPLLVTKVSEILPAHGIQITPPTTNPSSSPQSSSPPPPPPLILPPPPIPPPSPPPPPPLCQPLPQPKLSPTLELSVTVLPPPPLFQ